MADQPEVIEERVVLAIRSRREHGLAKYGVGVERTDLTPLQWLQHAKEEAMDLSVYLERIQALGELMPEAIWKPLLRAAARYAQVDNVFGAELTKAIEAAVEAGFK